MTAATANPLRAADRLKLADLPGIKERAPLRGALHLAGLIYVVDLMQRGDDRQAILDRLRSMNFSVADALTIITAVGDGAAATANHDGNGKTPARGRRARKRSPSSPRDTPKEWLCCTTIPFTWT